MLLVTYRISDSVYLKLSILILVTIIINIQIQRGDITYELQYDVSECDGCVECVEICLQGVWKMGNDGREVTPNQKDCIGCESCIEVCPTEQCPV